MGTENIVVGVSSANTIKVGAYGASEGASVSLGLTSGGIELEVSSETLDVFVDQHLGKVEQLTTQEGLIARASIAEASLAVLAAAYDQPVASVTGGTFTFGDKEDIRDYRTVYINSKGPGPGTRKITIYRAKIVGNSANAYKKDEVTLIPIEIHALADPTRTAGDRMFTVVDVGTDVVAPVVALTTPIDGGTVTHDTKGIVVWTITEANLMDTNTIIYGSTFFIMDISTPASPTLVAGSIVYSAAAKTVTFTPTSNWGAGKQFQATVTTGLKDAAGNSLAAIKLEAFTSTS